MFEILSFLDIEFTLFLNLVQKTTLGFKIIFRIPWEMILGAKHVTKI